MVKKYYMVLDDYPDHAAALGRMLGHWGELETNLMELMGFLFQVGNDHVTHHKTDFVYKEFVSLISKITLLERLNRWFILHDKPLNERIKKLLSEVRRLNKERNKYVHARWHPVGYGDISNQLIRISLASPGNINELYNPVKRLTSQDINHFGEEIVTLSLSFQELLCQVRPSPSI